MKMMVEMKIVVQSLRWVILGLILFLSISGSLGISSERLPPNCYHLQETVIVGNSTCLERQRNIINGFIPMCASDGTFQPTQCLPLGQYCWCTREDGAYIPGTIFNKSTRDKPDCLKERAPCDKSDPEASCDKDGFYNPKQCWKSGFCWCSERDGTVIPKTTYHDKDFEKPDCYMHRAIKFECNRRNFGLSSHPFDCKRYIYCQEKGALICLCPSQMHYNEHYFRCDWPKEARCNKQP